MICLYSLQYLDTRIVILSTISQIVSYSWLWHYKWIGISEEYHGTIIALSIASFRIAFTHSYLIDEIWRSTSVALVDVNVISHVNFAHFRACALFRFTFRDQNWQDNNWFSKSTKAIAVYSLVLSLVNVSKWLQMYLTMHAWFIFTF